VRLDRWLKRHFAELTQGQVEKLCRTGQVRVDGGRVKPNTRLTTGQTVRVPPIMERETEADDAPWKTDNKASQDADFVRGLVIHEDEEMLALNKPPGISVQGGTSTNRHIDGLLDHLRSGVHRPKLVHRLDRDTSGVLLLAKTPAAAARLGDMFRTRELHKIYWAVTVGVPQPKSGQIRSWMIKDEAGGARERERMRAAVQSEKGSVHAVTDYAVVSTAGTRAAWVALKPLTGRTHQLRFHMEEMRSGILGDPKYPPVKNVPDGLAKGLHLHARALIVPRPHGRPLSLIAELHPHMRETFAALGFLEAEAGPDPLSPFA
jgi:23S rRNA pseudouridine955/2504/2580 synthase